MKLRRMRLPQAGFTMVELILALTISTIMASVLFMITLRYYANSLQSEVAASMALESQTMLMQLVDDIRLADGIETTNQLGDTNAPAGGWVTSDPSNIIIISSPVVDSNREIIYDPLTGYPYRNELIYFSSGTTMYKRTLKNTVPAENIAVTTCPPASATASCPADRKFTENILNLTFIFYDANNVQTADATQARSVKLTANMSKTVFGKTIALSNSTQVTLRNH